MSQDDAVDSDDRRARAAEAAAAYERRVAQGAAEPREEFLSRHEDLRGLLEDLLGRSHGVTKSLPPAEPGVVSLPEVLQQEILAMHTGSTGERAGKIEELLRKHPQYAEGIRSLAQSLKGAEDRVMAAMRDRALLPQQIGPYRILSVLGEGGMGTVYVAEQREPVRRRVALKVIKLGMDSKVVLLRFEAERQALAMMEHDNIAKVFDAGTTELGQPYFAMELVSGQPLHEYCDRQRLDTRARLRLFQKVCSGVQHAHQKGVIHRDLKPGNILVSAKQGGPVPKIIDFGVAKATDHQLTEATIFTAQGSVLGTPDYMSPEQIEFGSADIDTRTDIYSLGVILYELLVGELPFSRVDLRRAGLMEIQRKIREDEPSRPSTRLTTLGEASQGLAQRRRTTVASLVRELRGDLDWITMRALEKERSRRYSTAQSLAEDIDRHLSHEPVMAGPPGAAYRMQKFIRRYRLQVVTVVLVFLALVAGTIGTAIGFTRAADEASNAVHQRDIANSEVQFMLITLHDKLQPIGRLDLLEDVALRAKNYYQDHSPVDLGPDERRNLALAWRNIGEILRFQGYLDDAWSAYEAAMDIQDGLLLEDPDDADNKADSARNQVGLGSLLEARGDLDGAISYYRESRRIMVEVVTANPVHAGWSNQLAHSDRHIGNVLTTQGDLAGALESFRSALQIHEQLVGREPENTDRLSELARMHNLVGGVLRESGDLGGALANHRQALDIRKRLVSLDPTDAGRLRDLAASHTSIGVALLEEGDLEGELSSAREALGIRRQLVDLDPANAQWRDDLAGAHNTVGIALRRSRDPTAALENYRESIRIREALVAQDSSNAKWKSALAGTVFNMGNAQRDRGDMSGASASYQRALNLLEGLVRLDPGNTFWKGELANVSNSLGILRRRTGDPDGAIASYRRAQGIREELVDLDPSNARWRGDLAMTSYNLGNLLWRQDDLEQALVSYEESSEALEHLVAQDPNNVARRQQLANVYNNMGGVLLNQGERQRALDVSRTTLAIYQDLVARVPANATLQRQLNRTHVNIAQVLASNELYAESAAAFERAFESPAIRNDIDQYFLYQAACSAALAAQEEAGDAAKWREQAITWLAEDLRLRLPRIEELERRIKAAPTESDAISQLTAELERHRKRIELARAEDPELEGLRGLPEFAALFEGR